MDTKYIAVDNGIQTAGAIIYWHTQGTMTYAQLVETWLAAGLERKLLPSSVTDDLAMKRALDAVADKRTLVRPLTRGSWALVREIVVGERVTTEQIATAKADIYGNAVFEVIDDSTTTRQMLSVVEACYERMRYELATIDVSVWLGRLMPKLDAVTLRDKGGVYFVPRHQIDMIRRVASVLKTISHHVIFEIPALRSDEAADAVLASLEAEAQTEVEAIHAFLDANAERQDRAYASRRKVIEAVREKVARYEQLFGRRMDAVHNKLATVRNRLASITVLDDAASDNRQVTPGSRVLEIDDRVTVPEYEDDHPAPQLELD